MYQAIIARIKVTEIPGANNIARGNVNGYTVIVSKNTPDNSLGVYFPIDGQLSHEMCMYNRLYRKHPTTGEEMGGYLDDNRRVRTKRFMNVESEGLFLPLESLVWTTWQVDDSPTSKLVEGHTFDSLEGRQICQRYIPRRNVSQRGPGAGKGSKNHRPSNIEGFPQHFDTAQLRVNLGMLRVGDKLELGEKLHGSSGRTCKIRQSRDLGFFKRAANKIAGLFGREVFETTEVVTYSGTRRCIVNTNTTGESRAEADKPYRVHVHNMIAPLLLEGEVVYYEIVGFEGRDGKPIMAVHEVPSKWAKAIGDRQVYSYGCEPTGAPPRIGKSAMEAAAFRVFVYRITLNGRDLTNDEMIKRCRELGLETCPQILEYTYDGNAERLLEICKAVCDGGGMRFDWYVPNMTIVGSHSPKMSMRGLSYLRNMKITSDLDDSHIREGVCVRVERTRIDHHGGPAYGVSERDEFVTILKYKGWLFCHLEDIKPNSDDNLDPDELEAVMLSEETGAEPHA